MKLLVFAFAAVAAACSGQSCVIADLSGSTGADAAKIQKISSGKAASGGNAAGTACIKQWWESKFAMREVVMRDIAACKPYLLVFARGTTEFGTMGQLVGPRLSSGLKSAMPDQWEIKGVPYDASIAGDNCVGIPGGKIAAKLITDAAARCPNQKIVVAGYSQGAMVGRIGTAFASDAAKKNVIAVVNFGDPFNGAVIKGFPTERIKIYCNKGDGVCDGQFKIRPAHLTYGGGPVKQAVQWIAGIAKAGPAAAAAPDGE